MKTSVIEVHDMLSVLSVDGVEKRIGEVPGVDSVTVNFAAGSATVRYDETRLEIADIKSAVRQSGYEAAAPAAASAGDGHEGHTAQARRRQPRHPLRRKRSGRTSRRARATLRRNQPRPPRPPLQATNNNTKGRRTKVRLTRVSRRCRDEVGAASTTNAPGTDPATSNGSTTLSRRAS